MPCEKNLHQEKIKVPVPEGVDAADIIAEVVGDSLLRVNIPGQESLCLKLIQPCASSSKLRAKFSNNKRVLTICIPHVIQSKEKTHLTPTSGDAEQTVDTEKGCFNCGRQTSGQPHQSAQRSTQQTLGSKTDDNPPPCAVCSNPTKNQCSKCKTVYYCSKDCQRLNYKAHKYTCPTLANVAVRVHPVKGRILIARKSFRPGEVGVA
jgi:hypothetical protein